MISLAFFRGLSHREIAIACVMPLGSVKTTMHKAFRQLQETFRRRRLGGARALPILIRVLLTPSVQPRRKRIAIPIASSMESSSKPPSFRVGMSRIALGFTTSAKALVPFAPALSVT